MGFHQQIMLKQRQDIGVNLNSISKYTFVQQNSGSTKFNPIINFKKLHIAQMKLSGLFSVPIYASFIFPIIITNKIALMKFYSLCNN